MIANLGRLKTEFDNIKMPVERQEGFQFEERKEVYENDEEVTYKTPWSWYGTWNYDDQVVPMQGRPPIDFKTINETEQPKD